MMANFGTMLFISPSGGYKYRGHICFSKHSSTTFKFLFEISRNIHGAENWRQFEANQKGQKI